MGKRRIPRGLENRYNCPCWETKSIHNHTCPHLLYCVCNTMETMITCTKRLSAHLEKHNINSYNQSGCGLGNSIKDLCSRLESEIDMAFTKRNVVEAVISDLEKALGLNWTSRIICKLKECIAGNILKWVHSFLKIQFRIDDETSDLHNLENRCHTVASRVPPPLYYHQYTCIWRNLQYNCHLELT